MNRSNQPSDSEALREEIRRTRADLGETVQALTAKADVKGRVKDVAAHKKDELVHQAQQRTEQVRERARHGRDWATGQARYAGGLARDSVYELGAAARRSPRPFAVAAGVAAALILFLATRRRRR